MLICGRLQQYQRQSQREQPRHYDHAHEAHRAERLALNVGDVAFEQTVAVEVTEHAVSNRVLEFAPVGGREMGGLVELDRALGILAEHAVDDTNMEMEVRVQR